MGIKCSVFGHDYADYDVERERADHGREVITTVRTTETCRRCGNARVVSENTEIAAASAVGADGSPNGENGRNDDEGPNGFEFDGIDGDTAGPDRVDGTGRPATNRSVGPTTAAATSRSLADSELWCPACEFSEQVLGSALRAGDSCPNCTRGYLARRTRKE